MQEIHDLKRQGVSIQAISQLTGHDRKTIRKYPEGGGMAVTNTQNRPRPTLQKRPLSVAGGQYQSALRIVQGLQLEKA